MPDQQNDIASLPHAALMVQSRHFSLIWIIPIVAAMVAGWLGWQSYISRGPTITINFESASGLEAGTTKIKYKDTDLGIIESVTPTADLSDVVAVVRMRKVADPYLTKGARFLLMKPSLYTRDLSGIGSLISGAYIEFVPGKGSPSRHFTAEESPAIIPPEEPGEIYTLHAEQLGSIHQGTPVYYRGIKVGEVLGYELSDKDGSANVRIFVQAPHNILVHTGTRFWNTSGISVMAGNAGFRIQLESVQSLLTGGIAFGTPTDSDPGAVAHSDTSFTLYSDEASAEDAVYTRRVHFLLHFAEPIPGLVVGTPVRMQGLAIGQVSDVHIEYDNATNHLTTPVVIEVEADRLKLLHSDNNSKTIEADTYGIFRKLIVSGLRARLASGNMLTGQKVIDLNLAPDAPPAAMIEGGLYPEIPTMDADDLDSVIHSAKTLLSTLQGAATQLNNIVSSPEIMASIRSLNDTLKEADKVLSSDKDGGDLSGTLRELKDAARSMRTLTDYLETHPEALLRGKPKDSTP